MLENVIEKNSVFCCPTCLSLLEKSENLFLCERCGVEFSIKDDIPVFGKGSGFFFWDIPKEKMESILEHIEKVGWQESVLQLQEELPSRSRKIWSRICNPRRWPWIFLLPINSESRVLDLGAGWGNNSISLARYCKEVYSLDTTYLYLKWLIAYAKNQNIQNIIPVHGGDSPHLPFKDDYFDVVIMSGVLEWIGESFSGNPQKSQQKFLNEVARVLKPDGLLYIGIENRISYKYFLGRSEGHIRMKLGSLLPRYVTRLLLKILRNKDFKVYTYSMLGYRRMLKRAGLDFTAFLAPIPNYSLTAKFMPICNSSKKKLFAPLSFNYSSRRQRFLMDLGAVHFVPSFSIFASPQPLKDNILRDMINHVLSEALGKGFDGNGKITSFKVKEKSAGRFVLKLELGRYGNYFLKIDTSFNSNRNILQAANILNKINNLSEVPERIKRLLPKIIKFGEFNKFFYLLEREAKGKSAEVLVGNIQARDRLSREAIDILKMLHRSTGVRCRVDDRLFDEYFKEPIYNIERWMKMEEGEKYKSWFANIAKSFYRDLMNQDLILVCRHGDFVPNNCVINPQNGRITTILDWEYAEEKGLPLLDLVSFLNRVIRPDMKKRYPHLKFPGYPEEFFSPFITDFAYGYLESLNISKKLYKILIFMWWAKYLEVCYPIYRYLSEWRKEAIFPIIERWNKVLKL